MNLKSLEQEASQRELILFSLVFFALVIFFIRLIYQPGSDHLSATRSKIEAIRLETEALQKFQQATPVVSGGGGGKNVKSRVLLGDIHSDYSDLTVLLPRLTESTLLGSLSLNGFNFTGTTQESGYSKTDFVLKTQGSFANFIRYLERLEQFPALFNIQDVILKMDEPSAEVLAEIMGRFYKLQTNGGKA